MIMKEYVVEYTLDNEDNDMEYKTGLSSLMDVNDVIYWLKRKYGNRIVKLDYKRFVDGELVKHITVI